MEKKNMYREYFPGYCGHIPFKYEVIGKTVGATNYHKILINQGARLFPDIYSLNQ